MLRKILITAICLLTFPLFIQASNIVTDTYTGTDGTTLNGTLCDTGQTRTALGSAPPTFTISLNQAILNGSNKFSNLRMLSYDSLISDCLVSVDMVLLNTNTGFNSPDGSLGFMAFRATDINNLLYASYNNSTSQVEIIERNAASETVLGSADYLAGLTGTNVEISLSGSSISLLVNNVLVLNVTDTFNQTATIHGIFNNHSGNGTGNTWDNFKVDTPTPTPTPTATPCFSPCSIINKFAANGTPGYTGDGGQATAAKIQNPFGIRRDASGNFYIADFANNVVRKITSGGVISTFAGTGVNGNTGDGGQATAAQIGAPTDIVFDGNGNAYIASEASDGIRKVATNGIITTFAGNGVGSCTAANGGQATAASYFGDIEYLAINGVYLYASDDTSCDRVLKINLTNGRIYSWAGTGSTGSSGDGGQATAAKLNLPEGIAFDSSGNGYIMDTGNNRIRKVAAGTGVISTFAGTGTAGYTGDAGQATAARINTGGGNAFPGISVDASGNVIFSDTVNDVVRMIDPSGVISTVAGNGTQGYSGDGGLAISAQLFDPQGIEATNQTNGFWLADGGNNVVRVVGLTTPVATYTFTATATNTATPTITATATITITATRTATFTRTATQTRTQTATATPTNQPTVISTPYAPSDNVVSDEFGVFHFFSTKVVNGLLADKTVLVTGVHGQRVRVISITFTGFDIGHTAWLEDTDPINPPKQILSPITLNHMPVTISLPNHIPLGNTSFDQGLVFRTDSFAPINMNVTLIYYFY